jgi:hypothetical protein
MDTTTYVSGKPRTSWNRWLRQLHRWVAIVFTVSVIVTTIALMQAEPVVWVSYVPLFPLALLMITGLYLLALPHVRRWRAARTA